MDKLRDISTIVDINTFNPYWLLLIVLPIALLAIWLLLFKRKKRYHFKKDPILEAKRRVKSIDYSNPKSVAYIFSQDVALFVDESNESEYSKIDRELELYKYRKDVPNLDKNLESKIKRFIKGIKWKV